MATPLVNAPVRPRYLAPTDELLGRLMREFDELPTLRLTVAQATRLWALDRAACQCALDLLVDAGFLARDRTGRYARIPAPH